MSLSIREGMTCGVEGLRMWGVRHGFVSIAYSLEVSRRRTREEPVDVCTLCAITVPPQAIRCISFTHVYIMTPRGSIRDRPSGNDRHLFLPSSLHIAFHLDVSC